MRPAGVSGFGRHNRACPQRPAGTGHSIGKTTTLRPIRSLAAPDASSARSSGNVRVMIGPTSTSTWLTSVLARGVGLFRAPRQLDRQPLSGAIDADDEVLPRSGRAQG